MNARLQQMKYQEPARVRRYWQSVLEQTRPYVDEICRVESTQSRSYLLKPDGTMEMTINWNRAAKNYVETLHGIINRIKQTCWEHA